jgi:hypothetical protein
LSFPASIPTDEEKAEGEKRFRMEGDMEQDLDEMQENE